MKKRILVPASTLIFTLCALGCDSQSRENLQLAANRESRSEHERIIQRVEQAKSPNSSSVSKPNPALIHQTDFLTSGYYTHLYPSFDTRTRQQLRQDFQQAGYTHLYLYIMNQNDYGGPPFDFYNEPERYKNLLQELHDDNLLPVVWLAPDDAPDLHRQYNIETLMATWRKVLPIIDPLVSSYVLGLEMDEYWSSAEQALLGSALNELTDKPILVHLRARRWEAVMKPWADGIIYQYGFGKSASQIAADTKTMLARLANHPEKVFIAGEYSHREPASKARMLGNIAMQAGALGFGNGGTPFITQ